jgi:hypothetical protein
MKLNANDQVTLLDSVFAKNYELYADTYLKKHNVAAYLSAITLNLIGFKLEAE